jgi:type IV pilus assembly protein PilF
MTQGICQIKAGQLSDAETSLLRSYALDPGNPITGYNLAFLMYKRGEMARAQFYIRRINNGDYANAESLWLGIKVERKLGSTDAMRQLADQLNKRFAQSRELQLYEKGSFDE